MNFFFFFHLAESSALGVLRCSCYLKDSTAEILQCLNDAKRNFAKVDEDLPKFLTKISDRIEASKEISVDKEYLGQILDHEWIKYDFSLEDGDQSDSADDSSDTSAAEEEKDKIDPSKNSRRAPRVMTNNLGESKLQQEIKKKSTSLDKVKSLLEENPHLSFVNWKDKCGYTAMLDACADGKY